MTNIFLQKAVELAASVDPHLTSPNPRVGCVVVCDGVVVSEGTHQQYGGPHAEVIALSSNSRVRTGAEIYLTLEPCDHFEGKQTPSCTDLIIQVRPKKLVVAALDPKFQGQNLEKIKAAGITVEFVDSQACRDLNPFLPKWHSDSPYPYVCLKIAQSLDGRITRSRATLSPDLDKSGLVYITNDQSRARVHQLRAQYSAVLTSTETIEQDDPQLDVRLNSIPDLPQSGLSNPQVVVIGKRNIDPWIKKLGREVQQYKTHDLASVLRDLKKQGIDSALVEVGQTLNTEFLKQDLVDEVQIFTAPVFLGEQEKAAFAEEVDLEKFQPAQTENLAGDLWISLRKRI